MPHFVFFCLAFLLGLGPVTNARALEVTAVRLGVHAQATRVVIDLDKAARFKTFVLANPARLVIDLPSYDWRAGRPVLRGAATAVRQGPLQTGVSRIVFDLSGASAVTDAFSIPRRNGQPDRIVVDFVPVTPAQFERDRTKIFGTLQTATQQAATQTTIAQTAPLPVPEQKPSVQKPPAQEPAARPEKQPLPEKKPLIVIDAGHGGGDPGALGVRGVREKDITLAMAKALRDHLEATGRYRVILTRDTDVFIRLSGRVAFARRHGGDLFISLHANTINRPSVHGLSIYTLSEKASDAETGKLAAQENRSDAIAGLDLDTQDEDVANILVDLAMRDTMNKSKFFANTVVRDARRNGIDTLGNTHRFAGFAVLKAPDIPSVLVELGYVSNRKEAAEMSSPAYRSRIAGALVDGIDDYFRKLNHKNIARLR